VEGEVLRQTNVALPEVAVEVQNAASFLANSLCDTCTVSFMGSPGRLGALKPGLFPRRAFAALGIME